MSGQGEKNPLAVAASALIASGVVTRDQVVAAQTRAKAEGGIFTTHLIEAGAPAAAVLQAFGTAYGLPVAPTATLEAVDGAAVAGVDLALCQRLLAVPFGNEDGTLQMAYAQPSWTTSKAAKALPAHRPFVAEEAAVRRALGRLAAEPTAIVAAPAPAPAGDTSLMASGLAAGQEPAPPATPSVATTGAASVATTGRAAVPGVATTGTASVGATGPGAPAPAARPEATPIGPGTVLGEFTVDRVLGGGGMATVYLAQGNDGREVALKVMQPQLANDPTFVQRFLHEVRSTIDVHHGNVVEVYSYGEEGGRYWMASEFVDGGTVDELMKKIQRMPAPLAVEIFAQLVSGLHFAHQQGIVHRDVKPANMLLTTSGVLKVADFGIAKTVGGAALTQTGMLVGTPAYMSPEQARGSGLDARSDLYAAGIVLYELLSGVNPNAADDAATTVGRLLKGIVPPIYEKEPTVPPEIEALLDDLLSSEPGDRPPSGQAVLEAIEPYLAAHRQRRPNLLAETLSDPQATMPGLIKEVSAHWLAEGRRLLEAGPAERRQASLALYRAVLRDPENAEANELLTQICEAEGIHFGQSANPKILELEALLAQEPDNAGILQRLANLYRNEGNLYKAVGFFKRYLRIRPDDGYTAGQLSLLTGHSIEVKQKAARKGATPGAAAAGTGVLASGVPGAGVPGVTGEGSGEARPAMGADTAALVAGVHTGGFKAAGPEAPGGRPEYSQHSEPVPDATALDYARAIWEAWGMKLVGVAVIAGIVWAIFSGIGGFISSASDDADRAAAGLRKGIEGGEAAVLQQQHKDGLAKADAEAATKARLLFEEALALYRKGKQAEAITAFERVRAEYPKRPQAGEAIYYIARSYLDTEQYFDAVSNYQRFIEEQAGSPKYVPALMGLGQAHYGVGQLPETIAACTKLLDEHPTSPLSRQARILRARANEDGGNLGAAADDYRYVVGSTDTGVPYYDEARAGLARVEGGG